MWAYSWKLHGVYPYTLQGNHVEARPASVLKLRLIISAVHQVPVETLKLLASGGNYLSDATVLSNTNQSSIVAWAPAFIGPWQSDRHTDGTLREDADGTTYWAQESDVGETPEPEYLIAKDTQPKGTSCTAAVQTQWRSWQCHWTIHERYLQDVRGAAPCHGPVSILAVKQTIMQQYNLTREELKVFRTKNSAELQDDEVITPPSPGNAAHLHIRTVRVERETETELKSLAYAASLHHLVHGWRSTMHQNSEGKFDVSQLPEIPLEAVLRATPFTYFNESRKPRLMQHHSHHNAKDTKMTPLLEALAFLAYRDHDVDYRQAARMVNILRVNGADSLILLKVIHLTLEYRRKWEHCIARSISDMPVGLSECKRFALVDTVWRLERKGVRRCVIQQHCG